MFTISFTMKDRKNAVCVLTFWKIYGQKNVIAIPHNLLKKIVRIFGFKQLNSNIGFANN